MRGLPELGFRHLLAAKEGILPTNIARHAQSEGVEFPAEAGPLKNGSPDAVRERQDVKAAVPICHRSQDAHAEPPVRGFDAFLPPATAGVSEAGGSARERETPAT